MKSIFTATLLMGTAYFGSIAMAQAQVPTPPAATPSPPSTPPRTAAAPASEANHIVAASELERGANSFTEGQARGRFEDAGFANIQNLMKDEAGFWRGRGMRNGATVDLAMDFRGRIAIGPGVASLPAPSASPRRGSSPAPSPRTDAASPPATTR
ncbi:hypothetical protein [Neoroseomonas lacus]|uniref:Uncharacterized protein n=1 Tax=Neoroseomonas lacus TaxID=287609 RepID=A0A917L6E6_9PROT|nr:hypothetical protein [Neoroseomonas lacus]GGJ44729.1 hypothetical protein GCM10011320_60230 [Neoroseomonas lacus]